MLEHITNELAGKTIKSVKAEPLLNDTEALFAFRVVFADGSTLNLSATSVTGNIRCPNTNMNTDHAFPA